ncbi:MAG: hypothetical protein Q8904_13425 [Bacteroidota bacterium]|nr:hypothetical protein [Bacteroidota bacterium]
MKKSMIIFVSVLMISLMGCSNSDEVKQNWVFTVTTVISVTPAMEGYPMTSTTTIEKSNLSSTEADAELKSLTTTASVTSGGFTMTTVTTATKEVKK